MLGTRLDSSLVQVARYVNVETKKLDKSPINSIDRLLPACYVSPTNSNQEV